MSIKSILLVLLIADLSVICTLCYVRISPKHSMHVQIESKKHNNILSFLDRILELTKSSGGIIEKLIELLSWIDTDSESTYMLAVEREFVEKSMSYWGKTLTKHTLEYILDSAIECSDETLNYLIVMKFHW